MEPFFTPTTESMYSRLPEIYRQLDKEQESNAGNLMAGTTPFVTGTGRFASWRVRERLQDFVGHDIVITYDLKMSIPTSTVQGPYGYQGSGISMGDESVLVPLPADTNWHTYTHTSKVTNYGPVSEGYTDGEIAWYDYANASNVIEVRNLVITTVMTHPLKRYISGVVDQVDEIAEMQRRFKYITPDAGGAPDSTSDLVDPARADDAWLRWLAQMLGAQGAVAGLTNPEIRNLLATPELAYGAGTPAAIAAAAQKALTGSKYVSIYNHTTNVSSIGGASQWDVLVATRSSETASGTAVLNAIKAAGAKPAGIVLWHRSFETTWANLEATYTTWSQIDALPNWTELEETGL